MYLNYLEGLVVCSVLKTHSCDWCYVSISHTLMSQPHRYGVLQTRTTDHYSTALTDAFPTTVLTKLKLSKNQLCQTILTETTPYFHSRQGLNWDATRKK